MKKVLITEVERNSKLDTLHLNFNHDQFVSYDKRSLSHSSGDYRVRSDAIIT